jgi:hypothetical protein
VTADLALIDAYDEQIAELERYLVKNANPGAPGRSPSASCAPRRGSARSSG